MAAAKKNTPKRRGGAKAVSAAHNTRLANALADASWADADAALAEALVEFAELKRALNEEPDALIIASQALSRVARRRGLAIFGDIGGMVAFDTALHEINGTATSRVRIVREGVMRGREVLVRAIVRPAPKAGKRAPR